MRRLVALLVVLAVGATAPAGALQTPPIKPAKHKPATHKPHKKKRHKKPAKKKPVAKKPAKKKPAATEPVVPPLVVADPGTPATDPVVAPGDPAAPPAAPAAPLSHVLGVTEKEFTLLLTRTTVGAGNVDIEVLNKGEDAHDLRIDRVGGGLVFQWDELASLERVPAQTLPLTPGTYRLYCTLSGHADLGMDKQITVLAG